MKKLTVFSTLLHHIFPANHCLYGDYGKIAFFVILQAASAALFSAPDKVPIGKDVKTPFEPLCEILTTP